MARRGAIPWLALALCAATPSVHAQDAGRPSAAAADARPGRVEKKAAPPRAPIESEPEAPAQMLAGELALLEKKKLAAPAAQSLDELDALLEDAHARVLSGRKDEATMLLLEGVEGPRFRSFESFEPFAAAELMLASLLLDQHALLSAQRSVDRLLLRGVKTPTFGPAFRRAVEIALLRRDYAASAISLRAQVKEPLPADAESELHYLTGLAAYDAEQLPEARRELTAVNKPSRFYARAQYLLGSIAAKQHKYDEASLRFCAVRDIQHGAPRTRYESAYLYPSEDLAQLGLGRVAHEQGRDKEAFAHYFQIPNDSPLVAEALFESAYASYEQGHPRTALDSLQQLEARYPESPYTAEARVLRGYVDLASCDFERAERELVTFEQTFGAVLAELNATLKSPARTHGLFAEQEARADSPSARQGSLLLGLLTRDPEVERLRNELSALDAELARGSRVPEEFSLLALRVRGKDAPRARTQTEPDEVTRRAAVRERLSEVHDLLALLTREQGLLRRAGAQPDALRELQATQQKLRKQSDALAARLRQLVRKSAPENERPVGAELGERLEQESAYLRDVRERGLRIRDELEGQREAAERRALEALRGRLEKELRRARIGRIDAVMGKKRKLELEVESLSAGRFPAELSSAKQTPTLLRDDQEYWPFEGEDWPDEFEERP